MSLPNVQRVNDRTQGLGINKQAGSVEKLFNAFLVTDTTEILTEPYRPKKNDIKKARASTQMVDKPSPSE